MNELLSQEEVKALFLGEFVEKKPDNFVNQLPCLQKIHEKSAEDFAFSLASYLRSTVEINLVSIERLSCQGVISSLSNNTCINIFDINPLQALGFLEINLSLVFVILDKACGGKGVVDKDYGFITDIEFAILEQIISIFLDCYGNVWRDISEKEFSFVKQNKNPGLVDIIDTKEDVVLVMLEARVGKACGIINLCLPDGVLLN